MATLSRRASSRPRSPTFADTDALSQRLEREGVVANAEPLDTGTPWWQSLLLFFGPTILFVALLFWLMRRAGRMQNVLGSFGRSRARRYQPLGAVSPSRTSRASRRRRPSSARSSTSCAIPRSTGGWAVDSARRVARGAARHGEDPAGAGGRGRGGRAVLLGRRFGVRRADVGVGASRVRDLFTQAKEAAPAIVFIDELDAIGRSRSSGVAGFSGGRGARADAEPDPDRDGRVRLSTGVIVLAATNRPDVLDPALLRPGRFDRRVAVQPPDRTGREAILAVHTRDTPLAEDVDLDRLAATTPAWSGPTSPTSSTRRPAGCAAQPRRRDRCGSPDALERLVLGTERKIVLGPEDRAPYRLPRGGPRHRRHAQAGADPSQVLDRPAGMALGVTFQPRTPTASTTTSMSSWHGSRSRSGDASPRRSCSAR